MSTLELDVRLPLDRFELSVQVQLGESVAILEGGVDQGLELGGLHGPIFHGGGRRSSDPDRRGARRGCGLA